MPSLAENQPSILEKIFKFCHLFLPFYFLSSFEKRAWPLILTDLNRLYQMMLCNNFGWNRETVLGKKPFSLIYFRFFRGSDPLFEQAWIPFTQICLCEDRLNLVLRFWRRRFLCFVNVFMANFVQVFSSFRYHLPLKKGVPLHLNKLESPSPKDALCYWLKLAKWFRRRRWKNIYQSFSKSHLE